LAGLKQKRDIGNQTDLTQYGLQPPRAKVVVKLDDEKTAELDLGSDNTYDGTLFAKRGDDQRVSILEAGVKSVFDKGLFDLRDKRILTFDDASLRHIDVGMPRNLLRSRSHHRRPVDGHFPYPDEGRRPAVFRRSWETSSTCGRPRYAA